MWIKLCANTTASDARSCAASGADAVGFVFAPSRRQVTPQAVAAMELEDLPAERVGVFLSSDASEVVQAARQARLTTVQLHGVPHGEDLAQVAAAVRTSAPELRVLPVVHWPMGCADAGERVVAELETLKRAGFRRVLLDAKVGTAAGGSGVAFDWTAAARAIAEVRANMQLILAGGLRPETVAEAIRVLAPWGVDVASGVESEPGRKSDARVREFVTAARESTRSNEGKDS